MLMRQLTGLQDRNKEFIQAITENDALARALIEDDMASTLTLIGEAAKAIAAETGISPELTTQMELSINTALTGLNAYAAARTDDKKRKANKVIDAGTGIKNLLLANPALPLTDKDRKAIVAGTNALFALAKIANRHAEGEKFDLKGSAAAVDDLIAAVSGMPQLSALGPIKATRATVHIAMAQYTLGRLEQDQAELARAYRDHATSEDFLNAKISQIDEWLSLYRKSLPDPSTDGSKSP
jgi:hypothetical protein